MNYQPAMNERLITAAGGVAHSRVSVSVSMASRRAWRARSYKGALVRLALCALLLLLLALPPGCGAKEVSSDIAETRIAATKRLRKTVFSSSARFVFVAGLEGTGHHLMTQVFKTCPICKDNYKVRCRLYNNVRAQSHKHPPRRLGRATAQTADCPCRKLPGLQR